MRSCSFSCQEESFWCGKCYWYLVRCWRICLVSISPYGKSRWRHLHGSNCHPFYPSFIPIRSFLSVNLRCQKRSFTGRFSSGPVTMLQSRYCWSCISQKMKYMWISINCVSIVSYTKIYKLRDEKQLTLLSIKISNRKLLKSSML